MRALAKPEVLQSALAAALISALASYPRLAMWTERRYGLWYLETLLFLCGTVLWAFVFAWHTKYTGRPLFRFHVEIVPLAVAVLSATVAAVAAHYWIDPTLRTITPLEYPKSLEQWVAYVLWSLTFVQLYLLFAPFAWLMRLSQNIIIATALTVLFGAFVMVLKNHSSPTPMPWGLFAGSLTMRLGTGGLAVYLLLRGGIPLVWLWVVIFQSRHLWTMG